MEFICDICPRKCGALRTDAEGFGRCGAPSEARIARAALHFWEEPCISGKNGSGTIFFCGCPLGCAFCQNKEISSREMSVGKIVSVERLCGIMEELAAAGAHNINLVSPTHYTHLFKKLKKPSVPVVYNCGGYESSENLEHCRGFIDIFLTDLKFYDAQLSQSLCGAADYWQVASEAVKAMIAQVGEPVFDEDGIMISGVIVRHLVLPGCVEDSLKILEWFSRNIGEKAVLSVMAQYTPISGIENAASDMPELSRRLKRSEYKRVEEYLFSHDLTFGFMQELSSAKEEYIPEFDLSGV